jgi:hypothetical protein
MLGAELAGSDLVCSCRASCATTTQRPATCSDVSDAGCAIGRNCGRNLRNTDVLLAGAASGSSPTPSTGGSRLDLRTGADRLVAAGTSARLTTAGLFYAYTGAPPWPGRIRFVPFEQLR